MWLVAGAVAVVGFPNLSQGVVMVVAAVEVYAYVSGYQYKRNLTPLYFVSHGLLTEYRVKCCGWLVINVFLAKNVCFHTDFHAIWMDEWMDGGSK